MMSLEGDGVLFGYQVQMKAEEAGNAFAAGESLQAGARPSRGECQSRSAGFPVCKAYFQPGVPPTLSIPGL